MNQTGRHSESRVEAKGFQGGHEENLSLPQPARDLLEHLKEYARQNPEIAAITCLAVGFVLGWKLKPW